MSRNRKGQTAQKAQYGTKAVPGKKALSFLFEDINTLKKQLKPAKAENPKKRKAESLLSTEEYFLIPPTISRTRINPVETSHPTTELVVSLNVNHEEHVLRALADTGASSSIILEAYASKDLSKQNKDSKTTWITVNGQFKLKKLD